jgi:hypothetical protein
MLEINEVLNQYKPQKYPKQYERICSVCGKTFITNRPNQKRCSFRCMDTEKGNGRFSIFLRDGFRCHYCGASPHKSPDVKLVIDHITPKASGGTDTLDNLITSCQHCNSQKADHLLPEDVVTFLKEK